MLRNLKTGKVFGRVVTRNFLKKASKVINQRREMLPTKISRNTNE
jgi:hypothetical protein